MLSLFFSFSFTDLVSVHIMLRVGRGVNGSDPRFCRTRNPIYFKELEANCFTVTLSPLLEEKKSTFYVKKNIFIDRII